MYRVCPWRNGLGLWDWEQEKLLVREVVLQVEWHQNPLQGLLKTDCYCMHPPATDSDALSLGWGLGMCIASWFPGGAGAGPGTTL